MNFTHFLEAKLKAPSIYFYSSTLFIVVFILVTFSLISGSGLHTFFNSDTLYLPSLYQDAFEIGNTLKNWHFSTSPYFFPDMVLFTITSVVTDNFIISIILYAIAQYLLILFLINMVLKVYLQKKERQYMLTIGNYLLALIPLSVYFVQDFDFSFHFTSSAFHNGAFVNALIALNFFIRVLNKKSALHLTLLFLTIFISIISDRFFTVYFIFPAIATTVFSLFDKENRKRKAIYLGGMALLTTISYTTFNLLKAYKIITVFNKTLAIDLNVNKSSFTIFIEQFSHYLTAFDSRSFALYFTIISFILLSRFIYQRFKAERLTVVNPELLLIVFLFFFMSIVLVTPILSGIYSGWDTLRYNFQVIIIGLLFFGITFKSSSNKIKTIPFLISFVAFFAFTCTYLTSKQFYTNLNSIVNYYPEKVKTIDEIAKKHDLQFGLANFWDARHTMMFSRENVRTYNCFDEMSPWYYTCNKDWFYIDPFTKDSVDFNFIIINNPKHEENFKKVLGDPLKIIDTNDVRIFITKPFRYNQKTYLPYYINE